MKDLIKSEPDVQREWENTKGRNNKRAFVHSLVPEAWLLSYHHQFLPTEITGQPKLLPSPFPLTASL